LEIKINKQQRGVKPPIKINIMKLIDRLKPEYKEILDRKNDDFPSLVGSIISCFEELYFVSDIKFGVWSDIKFFTKVESPYELFVEL